MPEQEHEQAALRREHTVIPDLTFPLNIFHIQETDPEMFCIPPHWHEHLEWIVVCQGTFNMQVGSTFRQLGAGDCMFVNRAQLHSAFPLETGSELYALVFGETLLRNHALDHTETRYIQPILEGRLNLLSFYEHGQNNTLCNKLLEIVDEYRRQEIGYELLIKAGLLSLLGLAIRRSTATDSHADLSTQEPVQSTIYPLLLHLSEKFREPITVDEAAKLCCVTPTYFCYVFKRYTGRTLTQYVNMLRVQEAEVLLRAKRYTVQEIARLVGYTNAGYFARVFRTYKGMAPRRYANGEYSDQ
ncbi:AraC family transcriptional regulator [Saccharibacillus sp. JS10]|uniref:helix-turn-helix transcriptional regulator n=1 Tax=Saccharibacillus sp. JS10 TaxID=2950552 RepID=UPI00210DD8D4|nr:AraC family transcriptional regulator [Saccharibacillus sp. JS10]MCQ4086561.1 AraC family transcriptional regulator [Saccharibacillus sp. JS10]